MRKIAQNVTNGTDNAENNTRYYFSASPEVSEWIENNAYKLGIRPSIYLKMKVFEIMEMEKENGK